MVIEQGGIFWAELPEPSGSEPGYKRPVVIVQNDAFNASNIRTTVVCILTSNVTLAYSPGNVLLAKGEANLPTRSVVNVSQIATVDKLQLKRKIGTLSKKRVGEIIRGMLTVVTPLSEF